MSFDRLVTLPWLARVEPTGTTRAFARSNLTSFRAEAGLAVAGGEFNAATLGTQLPISGGCHTITATFKFGINSFHTDAWVVPGPGFALAQVGIDFFALRLSRPSGLGMEVFTQQMTLSRSIAPLTWVAINNGGGIMRFPFIVRLLQPTEQGEIWGFFMRAFAQTAGGGVIAGGGASVQGFLGAIRLVGT